MTDDLLALYQAAVKRARSKPVTLGAKTSKVVSVRFTFEEAEAIRKIAKSKGINGSSSELIRAVTLAYSQKDPDAARCLLAVYHAKQQDVALTKAVKLAAKKAPANANALDGAGGRKPLSDEELAYCEREGITPAEFLARAAARVKASKPKKASFVKTGSATLARRPRKPITALERRWCAENGVSEIDFIIQANETRAKFTKR